MARVSNLSEDCGGKLGETEIASTQPPTIQSQLKGSGWIRDKSQSVYFRPNRLFKSYLWLLVTGSGSELRRSLPKSSSQFTDPPSPCLFPHIYRVHFLSTQRDFACYFCFLCLSVCCYHLLSIHVTLMCLLSLFKP